MPLFPTPRRNVGANASSDTDDTQQGTSTQADDPQPAPQTAATLPGLHLHGLGRRRKHSPHHTTSTSSQQDAANGPADTPLAANPPAQTHRAASGLGWLSELWSYGSDRGSGSDKSPSSSRSASPVGSAGTTPGKPSVFSASEYLGFALRPKSGFLSRSSSKSSRKSASRSRASPNCRRSPGRNMPRQDSTTSIVVPTAADGVSIMSSDSDATTDNNHRWDALSPRVDDNDSIIAAGSNTDDGDNFLSSQTSSPNDSGRSTPINIIPSTGEPHPTPGVGPLTVHPIAQVLLDRISSSPNALESANADSISEVHSIASKASKASKGSRASRGSKNFALTLKSGIHKSSPILDDYEQGSPTYRQHVVGSKETSGALEQGSPSSSLLKEVVTGQPRASPPNFAKQPIVGSASSTALSSQGQKGGHSKRSSVTNILFRRSSHTDLSRSDSSVSKRNTKLPEDDATVVNMMQICAHVLPTSHSEKRSDRVIDLLAAFATFVGEDVSLAWWYNQYNPLIYVCSASQQPTAVVEFLESLLKLFTQAVDVFTRTQDFGFELRLFPSVGPDASGRTPKEVVSSVPNRARALSVDSSTSDASGASDMNDDHSGKSGDFLKPPPFKKSFGSRSSQQLVNALDFNLPNSSGTGESSWEDRLVSALFIPKTRSYIAKIVLEEQSCLDVFKKLRIADFREMVNSSTVKMTLLEQLKTKGRKLPSDNYLIYYMRSARAAGDSAKFKVYIEKYIEWLEGVQSAVGKVKSMNDKDMYNFCKNLNFAQNSICFEYVFKTVSSQFGAGSKKIGTTVHAFEDFVTKVGQFYQNFQVIFKSISQRDFAGVYKYLRIVPIVCPPPYTFKVKPWEPVLKTFGLSSNEIGKLDSYGAMERYPVGKSLKITMDPQMQLMEYIWKRHYLPSRHRFMCYVGSSRLTLRITWEVAEVLKNYGAHFQLGSVSGDWTITQIAECDVRLSQHDLSRLGLDNTFTSLQTKDEVGVILSEYLEYFLSNI